MKTLVEFITSAVKESDFPPETAPEIAFLGRSNVGKSSLINSLLGARHAFVSRTPGRTQMINFFALRRGFAESNVEMIFADLPGYGYAKVPRRIASKWPSFIDPYLRSRRSLVLCVCLVDSTIPIQPNDQRLQEFLKAHDRRIITVATKVDRLSGNERVHAVRLLEKELQVQRIIAYSAKTGVGKDVLWREIREALR